MRALLLLLPGVVLSGWLADAGPAPQSKANGPAPDYPHDVAAILDTKCNRCHTATKASGKLLTTSRAGLLKGGVSGPAIEPGKPDKSFVVELVYYNEMPPKGEKPRVSADELKRLKEWIAAGAPEK
jgi:cytochrome c5